MEINKKHKQLNLRDKIFVLTCQLDNPFHNGFNSSVFSEIYFGLWNKIREQLEDQLWEQLREQLQNQLWDCIQKGWYL